LSGAALLPNDFFGYPDGSLVTVSGGVRVHGVQLRPCLTHEIKIRAAHEIMEARTTQLALFVD